MHETPNISRYLISQESEILNLQNRSERIMKKTLGIMWLRRN